MRLIPILLLLGACVPSSAAEGTSFWRGTAELPYQVSFGGGLGQEGWTDLRQTPYTSYNDDLVFVEAARGWALDGHWRTRVLLHEAMGSCLFRNTQAAMEISRSLPHPAAMPIRFWAGLSLNNVEGTLRVHPGFLPPYGTGAFENVSQHFRPGARLGVSFQPVKRVSVEATWHYVALATVGAGPYAVRSTTYGGVVASFHFGSREVR